MWQRPLQRPTKKPLPSVSYIKPKLNFTSLIQKRGIKTNFNNRRAMTFLDTIYKILAKPLAKKVQPMLYNIIKFN